jgi:hypothetical protein
MEQFLFCSPVKLLTYFVIFLRGKITKAMTATVCGREEPELSPRLLVQVHEWMGIPFIHHSGGYREEVGFKQGRFCVCVCVCVCVNV